MFYKLYYKPTISRIGSPKMVHGGMAPVEITHSEMAQDKMAQDKMAPVKY